MSRFLSFLVSVLLLMQARSGFARGPAWTAVEVPGDFHLLSIDGRTDVLHMSNDKLRRLHGGTGAVLWTRGLTPEEQPSLPQRIAGQPNHTGVLRALKQLPGECPDLNGDGFGDLVFGLEDAPDLIAVSGKDGSLLWWYRSIEYPWRATLFFSSLEKNYVVTPPLFADVDRDGVADVLVVFSNAGLTYTHDGKEYSYPDQTSVQAISGRTGKRIWSQRVSSSTVRPHDRFGPTRQRLTLHRWQDRRVVTLYLKDQLLTLDVRDGKPVAEPMRVPEPRQDDGKARPRLFDPHGTGALAVLTAADRTKAISLVDGKTLWESDRIWMADPRQGKQGPQWPLIADLAGDGKVDLLLPFHDKDEKNADPEWSNLSTTWFGVERFDGRTGQIIWRSRLYHLRADRYGSGQQGITGLVAGPDLNGDGVRDLFAVLEVWDHPGWEALPEKGRPNPGPKLRVGVCALSGADGTPFWQIETPERFGLSGPFFESLLDVPFFWQPTKQARPQLVVPRSDPTAPEQCNVWIIDPVTGKIRATWPGLKKVSLTDFDGDGVLDLYGFRPNPWNRHPEQGALMRFTGTLATDASENGSLPSDAATHTRGPMQPSWAKRVLPWAETKTWPRNLFALTFLVPLVVLVRTRWYRTAVFVLLLALTASAVRSWQMLRQDAPFKEPDQYYVWLDWYGVAAWVFGWLALILILVLAACWAFVGYQRWMRYLRHGPEYLRELESLQYDGARLERDLLSPQPQEREVPETPGNSER